MQLETNPATGNLKKKSARSTFNFCKRQLAFKLVARRARTRNVASLIAVGIAATGLLISVLE